MDHPYDVQALSEERFNIAKWWWSASNTARAVAYVFGSTMAFFELWATGSPFLVGGLFALASFCRWVSNQKKQDAELLRRKLDFQESFGTEISKIELADLKARLGRSSIPKRSAETYFTSSESELDFGGERAFLNLRQSAWWSDHLAKESSIWCAVLASVLVLASIFALIVSIKFVGDLETISGVAKVVTSTLYFVFSVRLFRSALAYRDFATRARNIKESCNDALGRNETDELSAMKMWHEYQLARAAAPPIPQWLYKNRRDYLNETWDKLFG